MLLNMSMIHTTIKTQVTTIMMTIMDKETINTISTQICTNALMKEVHAGVILKYSMERKAMEKSIQVIIGPQN